MKTIKELKELLHKEGKNTLLGEHLNSLFPLTSGIKQYDATIHNLDEKIEVIVQMHKNGIDAFLDSYKLGSVTKAYYQIKLNEYKEYN